MSGDDAKFALAEVEFGDDRAARFESRQFQPRAAIGFRLAANQQRIAMPAMPVGRVRLDQKMHARLAPDRGWIKQAAAPSEAAVDLLQGDKIGGHFADDRNDA